MKRATSRWQIKMSRGSHRELASTQFPSNEEKHRPLRLFAYCVRLFPSLFLGDLLCSLSFASFLSLSLSRLHSSPPMQISSSHRYPYSSVPSADFAFYSLQFFVRNSICNAMLLQVFHLLTSRECLNSFSFVFILFLVLHDRCILSHLPSSSPSSSSLYHNHHHSSCTSPRSSAQPLQLLPASQLQKTELSPMHSGLTVDSAGEEVVNKSIPTLFTLPFFRWRR